jgi:UDP-N-acetylmuramoyl-L-alanyl-D-glutamate--2,6-diaminopimelate ligase
MPATGSSLRSVAARVGGIVIGDDSTWLTDATHDSAGTGPETLFVAVRGSRHDGHDFVDAAVEAGSPAVAVEHPVASRVSQLVVADTRAAMGAMAAEVHNDPSESVAVIGVTGTNGKTTVTHYLESVLGRAGHVAGLIGTVHTRVGELLLTSARTTPEATDFQRLLATMRDHGADVIAAEVSSHALEMGRVGATRFRVAAFTNLSQDHLDFHGTMGSYREAKERLFRDYDVGTAVINVDDEVGEEIASWAAMPVIRVGSKGEVRAERVAPSLRGTSFDLVTPFGSAEVHSPLVGSFNVENALVASACCLALGTDLEQIATGLGALEAVPGRFQVVSAEAPIHVIVDYAHTPGGILEVISVARRVGGGARVIAVVGAGGDRDREKRPLMGRAAAKADVTILTSDNPRSEDPGRILAEVAAGAGADAILEIDRRTAIETAIAGARPGDIVLILGKGHETGQEIGGSVVPFDDVEVARQILESEASSQGSELDSGSMSP